MELALFVLLAVLASQGFARGTTFGHRLRVAGVGLVCGLVVAVVGLTLRSPVIAESDVVDRPIEAPIGGFVGSDTCRSCHPREYATWDFSYHSRMTQAIASPDVVLGDFDDVRLELRGQRYLLRRDGDNFFVEVDSPAGTSERHQLLMTTGSHHMQVYWYATGQGRRLDQLPFLWLTAEQRWVPRYAAFLRPAPESLSETGRWNITCNKCHSTNPRPGIANESAMDTQVSQFGIACEACHGPGEEHRQANRDPRRRYRLATGDDGDPTIVNPNRLDHQRASHVCAQCHATFTFASDEEYAHWKQDGYTYRPGDLLTDTRFFIHPDQQHPAFLQHMREDPDYIDRKFWPDGVLRMAGREFLGLLGTGCFQRGEMSCMSCHAMHQPQGDPRAMIDWADDQLKPGMRGNAACVQCHESYSQEEVLVAHTHHEPDSSGSNCYNCHMPYTAYGLLKAIRSHQMDSPRVATSLATGRPNGCNQCHLDKTLAWTAEQLLAWYGQPLPDLTADQQSIAASVLWIVSGDASQRAMMAWSMGWEGARQVSGDAWMAPFLVQLLVDPYDAVRFIAHRSLRQLPGFSDFDYDYVGDPATNERLGWLALAQWERQVAQRGAPAGPPSVLLDLQSRLRKDEMQRLLAARDQRVISLDE